MALTVTEKKKGVVGDLKYAVIDVAFDSSYPTGGEALAADKFGFPAGEVFLVLATPNGGFIFEYDYTNKKLLVFEQSLTTGATTVADSTSGAKATGVDNAEGAFRAMGTAVSTLISLGELTEIAAATDLSATGNEVKDVRILAFGK